MARRASRSRRGRDDDDGDDDDRNGRRGTSRVRRDEDDEDSGTRGSGRSGRGRARDDGRGGGSRGRERSSRESGGRARGGKFRYRERDSDTTRKRAEQSGRDFHSIVRDGIKVFRPKEGSHKVRVLPPTWDDADHFGHDLWLYYGIGPDDATVLCPSKMLNEADPIAEEERRARKDGDETYAKSLTPRRRVGMWIIDRKQESEGPMFWSAPWTFDRDLSAQALDDEDGRVLPIDHPDEGYDVSFRIEGKGIGTKYLGVSIARRESELGRHGDDWLEYIQENPIPDVLNFMEYDALADMFAAAPRRDKDDDDDDDRPRGRRGRDRDIDDDDEEDDRPKRGGRGRKRDDDFRIDDIEEGQMVMVIVDREEFEGECIEVGRKTFVLDVDGKEEEFRFDEVDEAEAL